MKIIDYIVLVHDSPITLQNKVTEMMKSDWQPLGGMGSQMLMERTGSVVFYQTMVKYGIGKNNILNG